MKNKKPKQDKAGQAYMKSIGTSVKNGQKGKVPIDKVTGVTPAVGSGIDPITNTSYPKRKKK